MEGLGARLGEALEEERVLPLPEGLPEADRLLANEALPTSVPLAVPLSAGVPLALGLPVM